MKHVFFIYYTCTLKYSDKLLIGTYRCFSWFVVVLSSSTGSTVINWHYRVIILYSLISTMVEYLEEKAKPYATYRWTPEVLEVLKCSLAFIKYLMVKIPYTPLGDLPMVTLQVTLHSITCLSDNLERLEYVTRFSQWKLIQVLYCTIWHKQSDICHLDTFCIISRVNDNIQHNKLVTTHKVHGQGKKYLQAILSNAVFWYKHSSSLTLPVCLPMLYRDRWASIYQETPPDLSSIMKEEFPHSLFSSIPPSLMKWYLWWCYWQHCRAGVKQNFSNCYFKNIFLFMKQALH